ncbi:MAG: hypothetical protein LBG88_03940 [Christensenellaceae bacterium]|jgi:5'-nucleotidase|nr:hypothetical protein [Christensenellaceae bacterium]
MNILIAKVGNIRVNEIKALAEELNKKHKVTICSMAEEAGYRGLAFSYRDVPIRVVPLLYKDILKNSTWVENRSIKFLKETSKNFDDVAAYEFTSQPADAISVMLCEIMAHKPPDLVICGISNGAHMGQHVYTSSNIGMAMEAAFLGTKVIAVGVDEKIGGNSEDELKPVAEFISKNVEKFVKLKLPPHTFLNINIPTVAKYKDLKGIKVARMSRLNQPSKYIERLDPKGEKYYWADRVTRTNADPSEEFGRTWFDKGYVTIVPINYDSTDYDAINDWNSKIKTNGGEQ